MRRWLLSAFLSFWLIVFLCIGILLTPLGLQITLISAKYLLPGKLNYRSSEGTLIGPLQLRKIHYKDSTIEISAQNIYLQWNPANLFMGKLHIRKLVVENLHITDLHIKPEKSKKTSDSENFYPLPRQFSLDYLEVSHFRYQSINDDTPKIDIAVLAAQNLKLGAQMEGEVVAQLKYPYGIWGHLKLQGTSDHYHYSLAIKNPEINWELSGEGFPAYLTAHTTLNRFLNGNLIIDGSLYFKPLSEEQLIPPFTINAEMNTRSLKFKLHGTHKKDWDIAWEANASNLTELNGYLTGALQAQGTVVGFSQHPVVSGKIHGTELGWPFYQIHALTGDWTMDLANEKHSAFNFIAEGVMAPSIELNHLEAHFNHLPETRYSELKLALTDFEYGKNVIDLVMKGDDTQPQHAWSGLLERLSIHSETVGAWNLQKPIHLFLGRNAITFPASCWSSSRGNVCLNGHWQRDNPWDFNLQLHQFSLGSVLQLIDSNMTAKGTLTLNAQLKGIHREINEASLNAKTSDGYIILDKLRNRPFNFNSSEFSSDLKKTTLTSQLAINLAHNNQIKAHMTIPWKKGSLNLNGNLGGAITVNCHNLSEFNPLTPGMTQFSGELLGEFSIAGKAHNPNVDGKITVHEGNIHIIPLKVDLNKIQFSMKARNHKADYHLQAYSEQQPITLEGSTHFSFDPWKFNTYLTLKGDNLIVANSLEYHIIASPNLIAEIQNENVNVTGSILIPKAELKPILGGGSVSMPDDVIYVGPEQLGDESSWELQTQVAITLGPDVTLDTSMVKAKLTGGVTLKQEKNQAMIGNGRIGIQNGELHIQNHKLTIGDNSAIIYANSLLENPNLDISISRIINTVSGIGTGLAGINELTVGIEVQGTANNPDLSFFSSPVTLSQTDILSYLILGHPSSGNSPAEISLLLELLNNFTLGDSQSSPGVTQQLTQGLGLSEFGVQSNTSLDALGTPLGYDQSSFVLGRYLSPKIYVRYSMGLDYPINILQMIYIINSSWSTQTESSALGSGADVLYTIEGD